MFETGSSLRVFVVAILVACLLTGPAAATCGGGGGGGTGGIASAGGAATVYYVPWVFAAQGQPLPQGELLVYWFPTGPENAQSSSMLTSRNLTLWSGSCVGVGLVPDNNMLLRAQFEVPTDSPQAIVAGSDGSVLGRIEAKKGRLSVSDVEKVVSEHRSGRLGQIKSAMKEAKQKVKGGDENQAAALYTGIASQCLFPDQARKAAKSLQKMGRPAPELADVGSLPTPDLRVVTTDRITALMEEGLAAERREEPKQAQVLYQQALALDPADPVVLRFLAELHRHHTGDWEAAEALFRQILALPSDRISRAVALHGLGKMTIHAGGFDEGLAMFESSLEQYPLALTYRNLAVFWNTEEESDKAYGYVQKALELDPEDAYNQVFAATYLVELGRPEEALTVARKNHDNLAASYNLAAIYAQLGERAKALDYLRRHFYAYERFDAVRAKEMREARDDIAFTEYHEDADFIQLTALADSDSYSYHLESE